MGLLEANLRERHSETSPFRLVTRANELARQNAVPSMIHQKEIPCCNLRVYVFRDQSSCVGMFYYLLAASKWHVYPDDGDCFQRPLY